MRTSERFALITAAVATVALALAGVASATTNVTIADGTISGTAGKGDLQKPWDWSNKVLQDEAKEMRSHSA